MDAALKKTCESFINNRDILKENFKHDGMAMHLMGAALLTSIENAPDGETLKKNEKILKKHEGIFSPFRGVLKLPVIINMSMREDAEEYLRMIRVAYDLICAKMGSRNERYYLPATSLAMAADTEDELAEIVDKSEQLLAADRSMDDLMTELGLSEEEITKDIKEVSDYLKTQKGFGAIGIGSEMRKTYAKMLVGIARSSDSAAAEITSGEVLDKAIESRYRAAQTAFSNLLLEEQLTAQMLLLH